MATAAVKIPEGAVPIANGYYRDDDHSYFDEAGREIPGVTTILEGVGLIDYSQVDEDVLEHKRDLGQAAHHACHIIARGDELDWDTVHEEVVPRVLAFEGFMKEAQFTVDVVDGKPQTEMGGIAKANGMAFGYRFDLRGRVGGMFPAIIDIKCACKEEKSWRWQTAAYELAQPKLESDPYRRIGLQLKPDGTFKFFNYDNPRDKDRFLWALALTWTKINERMKWKRS